MLAAPPHQAVHQAVQQRHVGGHNLLPHALQHLRGGGGRWLGDIAVTKQMQGSRWGRAAGGARWSPSLCTLPRHRPTCSVSTRQSVEASRSRAFSAFSSEVVTCAVRPLCCSTEKPGGMRSCCWPPRPPPPPPRPPRPAGAPHAEAAPSPAVEAEGCADCCGSWLSSSSAHSSRSRGCFCRPPPRLPLPPRPPPPAVPSTKWKPCSTGGCRPLGGNGQAPAVADQAVVGIRGSAGAAPAQSQQAMSLSLDSPSCWCSCSAWRPGRAAAAAGWPARAPEVGGGSVAAI